MRLYVGNIHYLATVTIVESWFTPFGLLKDIYMPLDNSGENDRVNRGFAFVTFGSEHSARNAMVSLHHKPDPIWGRTLVVQPAKERPAKPFASATL